ncbi:MULTISPECIES: hypothetical protein [unclassified Streptomyces]|uniref:hypothetical protein n=1 Tax=unclassified Streptomyces TaxID=2593676 RepID=UPI003D8D25F0
MSTPRYARSDALTRFYLLRSKDVTGVSGTGRVAGGDIFSDGTVAMRWNTGIRSTAFYSCLDDVLAIHGHDGATVVDLIDE